MRRLELLRIAALMPPVVAANLRAAGAQSAVTVHLGLAEGDDATPALYAISAGLFVKYGLDVQIVHMPSGAAALAALAGGAIDIGGTSLLPFISAHARGLPLQIVGPLAVSDPASPYAALLVRKDAPYKSGRDLNGKTIASPALRDLNWVATMAWIDRNGGDSSTVKSIELPSSATLAGLAEGRVDASTVTTPRYVQALNTGTVRVLGHSYDAIARHFAFAAYASTIDYASKNPAVIERFGRAIRDATRYTNTHHADTLELYANFAKIDPKTIADAPRAVSAEVIEAADLQPMIDAAVRYKLLDHPIDPHDLISPAILKRGA